jgi:hypothetical protein
MVSIQHTHINKGNNFSPFILSLTNWVLHRPSHNRQVYASPPLGGLRRGGAVPRRGALAARHAHAKDLAPTLSRAHAEPGQHQPPPRPRRGCTLVGLRRGPASFAHRGPAPSVHWGPLGATLRAGRRAAHSTRAVLAHAGGVAAVCALPSPHHRRSDAVHHRPVGGPLGPLTGGGSHGHPIGAVAGEDDVLAQSVDSARRLSVTGSDSPSDNRLWRGWGTAMTNCCDSGWRRRWCRQLYLHRHCCRRLHISHRHQR